MTEDRLILISIYYKLKFPRYYDVYIIAKKFVQTSTILGGNISCAIIYKIIKREIHCSLLDFNHYFPYCTEERNTIFS